MRLIKCRAQSILEEGKSENKPTFPSFIVSAMK